MLGRDRRVSICTYEAHDVSEVRFQSIYRELSYRNEGHSTDNDLMEVTREQSGMLGIRLLLCRGISEAESVC